MSEMMHEEVMKACEALKKGGVILYPTDTVWGLGCDATRVKAVERIYRMKKRPESKSLIILLDQLEKLYQFVEDVPATAIDLINSVETPLTIIYPNARDLARNLIAPWQYESCATSSAAGSSACSTAPSYQHQPT